MEPTIEIFLCYANRDKSLLEQLKTQLTSLQHQGRINLWDDSYILAGVEWESEIESHLNTAQIILLLVSPDFMASDQCFDKVKRAMARYQIGEARVIPIILRPVHWQEALFGKLTALPTQAMPITDPRWPSLDEAFYNVADGIRKVVEQLTSLYYETLPQKTTEQDNDKALNDLSSKEIFGYLACPNCRSINFTGERRLVSPLGEVYNLIQCKECGWRGKIVNAEKENTMQTQLSDYVDVEKRALELGCNVPSGLAILPTNFDAATSYDELIHESTTPTIRSLWRQAGISETRIEKEGSKLPQRSKKSWEWVSPLIFVSQWMLTNAALPITINIISTHLSDILKGHRNDADVTLEFVVETIEQTKRGERREYKRVSIKGSPKEIEAFDVKKLKQLTEKANK